MAAHAGAQALSRERWNAGRPQLRLLLSSGCDCQEVAGHDLNICDPIPSAGILTFAAVATALAGKSSLADEMSIPY